MKKVNSSFFARNATRIIDDMEANRYPVMVYYKTKPAAVVIPIGMYNEWQKIIQDVKENSKR